MSLYFWVSFISGLPRELGFATLLSVKVTSLFCGARDKPFTDLLLTFLFYESDESSADKIVTLIR